MGTYLKEFNTHSEYESYIGSTSAILPNVSICNDGGNEVHFNVWHMPNNEIWYTSTDDDIVYPFNSTSFGANIISNTYKNGQGKIVFDGNVTSIGLRAFKDCYKLASIVPPPSVTVFGDDAFMNCTGLTSVTIPNGVTSIGTTCFFACNALSNIDLPETLTSIGNSGFTGCKNIVSIIIPDNVNSIGNSAFSPCTGLTSVTLPNNSCTIGFYAFSGSSITSLILPPNIQLYMCAFGYCRNLTSITCLGITPNSIGTGAFNDTNDCPIYVPSGSVNAYKSASGWSTYASRIQAISS